MFLLSNCLLNALCFCVIYVTSFHIYLIVTLLSFPNGSMSFIYGKNQSCTIILKSVMEPGPIVQESTCRNITKYLTWSNYYSINQFIFIMGAILVIYLINFIWYELTLEDTTFMFDYKNHIDFIVQQNI
ncbi:hypothetical protein HZS_5780 [Henneguya salminicola]|nr:hypothetical protein HZS_5780 [Henneguya salminicola]